MKLQISPTLRISFGLLMITLSIIFASDWLGLIPREQTLKMENRKHFSETVAVLFSSMAQKGDSLHIRTTLEAIVERDPNVQSASFHSLENGTSIEAGNHSANWKLGKDGKYSTFNQVVVPIFKSNQRWGSVEISFSEEKSGWYNVISNNSFVTLIIFITASGFFLYLFFLRRVLRELDPSQAVPERVKSAFNSLAEGVLILDDQAQIVLANSSFAKNSALDTEAVLGTNINTLNWSVYQTDTPLFEEHQPWTRVVNSGKSLTGEKITMHKNSSLERSYTVNCTAIRDGKDGVRGVIITFDDVTELEKKNTSLNKTLTELKQIQVDVSLKNKELEQLATRDPLTNCLNRRSLTEHYAVLFDQANATRGDLVCIMADIDHFKRVNDNYGHAVGDKVIKFVAGVLNKQTRRDDLIGRYGGEEFCLILNGASVENASAMAERMRLEIATGDPNLFTSALKVTVSFGLASIHDERDDRDELVNKADRALYLAKESGRNKVMVWEDAMNKPTASQTGPLAREDRPVLVDGMDRIPAASASDSEERIKQLEQIALEQAEQFDHYAAHDPLTDLPVRGLFMDRIERALASAKRDGRVLAVLSLGLHNLQRVNDTLGHDAARELLSETSKRLNTVLRASDSVALIQPLDPETTISKLNEGEFGLLLPAVEDSEAITWIVKRIFDHLQEPVFIGGHNLTIISHIGIGVYPADGADAITLIKHASISRHYAEQRPGANNVEYFSEQINRVSREQFLLESEMSDAINREDFEVFYQPKIDVQTEEITGFEALLRWNHVTRGLLTPDEFIDIAERTRLINLIGDWVLKKACQQITEFNKYSDRRLTIAVNLSAVQLSLPDLADRIQRSLQETGTPPEDLELELTESCLIENMEETFRSLTKLQAIGVNISIDDFGTGFSGLGYLRTLPTNILKVDRCFIADIDTSEHDRAIVFAIVSMAKALDLRVIAEGVETHSQMKILKEMNCDEVQGYLFSRPVNAEKAAALVLGNEPLANVV